MIWWMHLLRPLHPQRYMTLIISTSVVMFNPADLVAMDAVEGRLVGGSIAYTLDPVNPPDRQGRVGIPVNDDDWISLTILEAQKFQAIRTGGRNGVFHGHAYRVV